MIILMNRKRYNDNEVRTPKRTKRHAKKCKVCEKDFYTYKISKKTCSLECCLKVAKPKKTGEYRNCKKCNTKFYCRKSEDRRGCVRKYCSKQCARKYPDRPDGLYISSDGYWCTKKGKKLHRQIYEDYYNVTLTPHDIIHHRNENKLDNRIENLQKVTRTEHNKIHRFLERKR